MLELHLTSRYVWNSCNWLASISVVVGLNSRCICYTCLRLAVMSPMLIPDQRHSKHSCNRPSGMYVTVTPDQQPCLYMLHTISMHGCYSFILSASMYVTFASDRQQGWQLTGQYAYWPDQWSLLVLIGNYWSIGGQLVEWKKHGPCEDT